MGNKFRVRGKRPPRDVGNPSLPPRPAVFPNPHRVAAPPPPHPTPLRQEISLGSLASRGLLPSAGRRSVAEVAQPRRPSDLAAAPQDAAAPQPPGSAHLHLFAEVARPGHRRQSGAGAAAASAAAATPAAPASRPLRGPPRGRLSGRRLPSVSQPSAPPQRHRRRLLRDTRLFNQTSTSFPVCIHRSGRRASIILPARLRRRRPSTAATAPSLRSRGPRQPRSRRHDGLRHVT